MAWYYRTYACGHEGRENVTGKTEERMQRLDEIFAGLCPECRIKQKDEEHAKANAEAEKKAAENNLPKLSGSEKQIAWANTIRMKFYEEYSNGQNDIETIIKSETESKF